MNATRSAFLTGAIGVAMTRPVFATLEVTNDPDTEPGVTAHTALQRLRDGNARFVNGRLQHPRQTPSRRTEVAPKQRPFAVVLDCSDSRVPPEIVFDQGLGDLFVCRVAGNVADDAGIASLQYAALHFHTPLLVVLGHSRCGAVAATLDAIDAPNVPIPGRIGTLVAMIRPAVAHIPAGSGRVEAAVDANARAVAAHLHADSVIANLRVVTGRFDLDSGIVHWLG
jgi:carbonic anhydrase